MPSRRELQRQKERAKKRFDVASRVEREYMHQIRDVLRYIDHIVKMTVNGDMSANELFSASQRLDLLLGNYAELIRPWALSTANKMIGRIEKIDENSWIQLGRTIGRELRKELNEAPTGHVTQSFLSEQVRLITSLPLEAASRVHQLTLNGITTGERADSIAKRILQTGDVTESRAKLIARTEVARTSSALTMARSEFVGSTHYHWRTSGDFHVRPGHKAMNNKLCEWANPPAVNEGTEAKPRIMYHHAGMIWNCRCYPDPVLED